MLTHFERQQHIYRSSQIQIIRNLKVKNMAPTSILLRGGTVLSHGEDDHVTALHDTDILIEGNLIRKTGASISPGPETRVIDCRDKIISPGFIDTHYHLWQTQLKGRFPEDTLFNYMLRGKSRLLPRSYVES
jgi:cytosine/adenosine deaminase-related metal-dependent hydrolase